MKVRICGGPHDGQTVDIAREPARIVIGNRIYERIDDPETGEPLGAYVATTRTWREKF